MFKHFEKLKIVKSAYTNTRFFFLIVCVCLCVFNLIQSLTNTSQCSSSEQFTILTVTRLSNLDLHDANISQEKTFEKVHELSYNILALILSRCSDQPTHTVSLTIMYVLISKFDVRYAKYSLKFKYAMKLQTAQLKMPKRLFLLPFLLLVFCFLPPVLLLLQKQNMLFLESPLSEHALLISFKTALNQWSLRYTVQWTHHV